MSTDQFSNNVKYSFYFGIIFKLITFTFNQSLVKFISPSFLAYNNFLDFIVNSITFFSGEGIRLSIQRLINNSEDGSTKSNVLSTTAQLVINLSYIPIVILIPVTSVIFYSQFNSFNNEYLSKSNVAYVNPQSIMLITLISIIITIFTEPFYNSIVSWKGRVEFKTRYESYGLMAGCIFNCVGIILVTQYADSDNANCLIILVFTLSKLVSSTAIFWLYFWKYKEMVNENSHIILLPRKLEIKENSVYFDPIVLNYFKNIFFQLIFKNFLTEGDKFVFNYFFSLYEQGLYSIINNYGSLVARMIFNPVEENLRAYLSKSLNSGKNKDDEKQTMKKSKLLLNTFIKYYVCISIFLIVFGYNNATYLVKFIFSQILKVSWWNSVDTEASPSNTASILFPKLAQVFLIYLPFLAFNGIFEAFCQSISTPKSVQKYSYYLSFCTVVFLVNCYLIINNWLHLGLMGLVISNIINMAMRIGYCWILIRRALRYEKQDNKVTIFKNTKLFISTTAIICFIQIFIIGSTKNLVDFVKSACLAFIYLIFILLTEFF